LTYLKEIFDDWLMKAAAVNFVLIVAVVLFNIFSDLPERYPLFGVILYSMVPLLFISGGIIFVLAILRIRPGSEN
jgi:hypothetical protein